MSYKPGVPQWGRFENIFVSTQLYSNPFQAVDLRVDFIAPSGAVHRIDAFWNGGQEWRVRFMPDEPGDWTFTTDCSDRDNRGLHGHTGSFTCGQPTRLTPFETHGPLRVSDSRRHLAHADGTPFFWLADTAWNGPLLSTTEDWNRYLAVRKQQRFSAVQWIATQWISAPDGDLTGELAYSGGEDILVHPSFFQRLDQKIVAINRAGLLSVPVMLWAARWSGADINARNPGYMLPEDQAIRLTRYMVARWGAYFVVWILPGDGDYRGEHAARWQRIGRAVFGDRSHAPVSLHPGGLQWNMKEFQDEQWLDLIGYQSGHGDAEQTLDWIVNGPPAVDWHDEPYRPFINLEAPYEDHISYQSRRRHDDFSVRRATYWSLLVSPTAGVTYGGHGVWAWDDGTMPPVGHPSTGIPLPWQEALNLQGARQLTHLRAIFDSFDWWNLMPAQDLLVSQPGEDSRIHFATVARSSRVVIAYLPDNTEIRFHKDRVPLYREIQWIDPRTGQHQAGIPDPDSPVLRLTPPGFGDWILLIHLSDR